MIAFFLLTPDRGESRVVLEVIFMNFVVNPNLPDNPVRLAVVDGRIGEEAEAMLISLGVKLLKLKPHESLYTAVCSHPDMVLYHIGGEKIVYAPGTDSELLENLLSFGFSLLEGESLLSSTYPFDIAYNVARVGSRYFHNLKYTDPVIRRQLEMLGVEPVHVEQGYAKCSVLPLDENSMITADKGIAKAAEKKGLEVLLVDCDKSIRLPGLDYGFIGGTGGLLAKYTCVFTGSIARLSCFDAMSAFLSKKGFIFKSLTQGDMIDIGSILPLMMS